jgi:4-amino-4-deoxy-L-arabinose transferase-like glycosyltransferase
MAGASAGVAARSWTRSFSIGLPTLALTAVTLLAGGLRFYSLADVPGNPFYDAAVRSMALSWHNFFFAAFEPSGRIAIDKPPVDLWLQVASVKLFGFNSVALKLPEAVAGTVSVPLLYDVVRRVFGRGAGLASGLALAVLPVTVLTARSDTMDTVMMLLVVAAAWLVVRSAQTGRARFLYAAAAVLGVAFNVKLFEALLPLPALVLLYLAASRQRPWRRLRQLVAAALVFAAVSLSWLVAISASPQSARPYPLGSTNGSVWNSVFIFDGLHRVGLSGRLTDAPGVDRGASPTRLLVRGPSGLGVRFGSELVPALLFGGVALLLGLGRVGAGFATGDARVVRRGVVLALALWVGSGFVVFSAVDRIETRYLEAFTPAVAAVLGIGLAIAVRGLGRVPGARFALAAAVTATAAYGLYLSTDHSVVPGSIVAGAAFAALLALAAHAALGRARSPRGPALTGSVIVLCLTAALAAPVSTSLSLVQGHKTAAAKGTRLSPRAVRGLDRYLTSHQAGARYEVATLNAWQAGSLIVHAGRPVIVLTNVNRRPLISARALEAKARAGEVRYALLGARCRNGPRPTHTRFECPPAARWVRAHGRRVNVAGLHVGLYRITPGHVA